MKITLISDTHTKHASLKLPGGDLLIHSGDVSSRGKGDEIKNFLDWFSKQNYTHKVFIAGNHDFYFEQVHEGIIKNAIPENVIYLNDSCCEIEGVKIWGSPVQPWFYDWAFNRSR
ncbi:MAG: metallophosphoesterase, partial [Bacteroidia bacterium]|nr:metallophosphoesterase [Bacteroidia bacterium]